MAGQVQRARLAMQAVKLLASHWYRGRESHGETDLTETPMGWKAVADMFKTGIISDLNGGR